MKIRRQLYGPDHDNGPSRGQDVVAIKRGLWNEDPHRMPRPPGGFDDVFNRKAANALKAFQIERGIKPATGNLGQRTLDELWPEMDAYARDLYVTKPKPVIARCFPIPAGIPVRDYGGVAAHKRRPLGNWQSDNAIDIGTPTKATKIKGAAILAPLPGHITKISGHDPTYGPHGTIFGQNVTIRFNAGFSGFFTHSKLQPWTELGEQVVAGEMLAWVSDFGVPGRWPEHLHIAFEEGHNPEQMWDWPRVNPIPPDQ